MLLHSYYSFEYILKLRLKNITRLLIKAKNKENDYILFKRWVANYESRYTFDEFKAILQSTSKVNNLEKETEEETLDRVKNIMDTFNKKVVV